MKTLVVLTVLSLVVLALVAQDSPSPADKVIASVMEDFAKAKADAYEKFEKAPAVVSLTTVRVKAVERAGKTATTKLEKLLADSKKAGSDLGVETAQQSIDDVSSAVQDAKLSAVGLDKLVVKFKGHAYLIILRPIIWKDADKLCKDLGGHLAYIETKEQMEFLQKQARVSVWVGATDEQKEDDWRWLNGKPVLKSLWLHDRPYQKARDRTCVDLSPQGLEDINAKDPWAVGFICEWDN